MLAKLERSRRGKTRASKAVSRGQVPSKPQDKSGKFDALSANMAFELVSTKRQRWTRISVSSPPRQGLADRTDGFEVDRRASATFHFASTAHENRARKAFGEADKLFTADLARSLSYFEFEHDRVPWLPFDGEYLDMGVLVRGSEHFFKIAVQNSSAQSLRMDVDVSADLTDLTLYFDPRSMPMGMVRNIIVKVMCRTVGEFLGTITVSTVNTHDNLVDECAFPLYLHVAEPLGHTGVMHSACSVSNDLAERDRPAEDPGADLSNRHAGAECLNEGCEPDRAEGDGAEATSAQNQRPALSWARVRGGLKAVHSLTRKVPPPIATESVIDSSAAPLSPTSWLRRSSTVVGLNLPSPAPRLASTRSPGASDAVTERRPLPLSLVRSD